MINVSTSPKYRQSEASVDEGQSIDQLYVLDTAGIGAWMPGFGGFQVQY